MREKILFNDNWIFHKGDFYYKETKSNQAMYQGGKTERMLYGPASKTYSDTPEYRYKGNDLCIDNWEDVTLPHDYIIKQVPSEEHNRSLGYFEYQNAWYRKHFTLTEDDENKRITLYFEGIATHSEIYINGCPIKRNFCGYTSFEVDITDFITFDDKNVVAVYVKTDKHEGWWYEGAGIYRNVWLVKTDKTSVDLWGVYINPQKNQDKWLVNVENTIRNDNDEDVFAKVKTDIIDADKNIVLTLESSGKIKSRTKQEFCMQEKIKNPHLWNVDDPYQYKAVTTVKTENGQIDTYETKFGFRTIIADADKGLFINDNKVVIKGVCSHQDFGLTGKAVPDNVLRHKVKMIKEMGANGFRCSHYPHPEATMDALDEMGFITMAETRWFDSSETGLSELEMLVKRDRNRPSVIFWSVGNEEANEFVTERGVRICKSMISKIKSLDNSRLITAAISAFPLDDVKIYDLLDVIGINYFLDKYDYIKEHYPHKPIVSSECCAVSTTRGWYYDDTWEKGYFNAVDKYTTTWNSGREQTWKFLTDREGVLGEYQWISFEHRGECYWPRLCSQSGAIDMFFQKKDAFYQNQSHWIEDKPVIHIAETWCKNGLEGEHIPVSVYTNCDEAELFLNGKSLGRKSVTKYTRIEWDVVYESGELKVIGYNNNKEVINDIRVTPKKATQLKLKLENDIPEANGLDMALVTCYCVDEDGNEVYNAEPFVKFAVNSLGVIVGTGSDICDHTPVTLNDRQMRAGRILAAVRVGKIPGDLKVYAEADNLKSAVITIPVK